ncbi:ABC transporter permease [uncultured Ilyobacter sp.]|uniref:ABC transporter permease n=1 Tax=uncultured Ilyobacter sp. TaxID=544433 RepID=UPI002AA72859|nr:ABC transporter permease [uncultured Ilyobacter sp.]
MKRAVDRSKDFFKYFFTHWNLIFELSKDDFKNRHAGSFFGVIWVFIQPLITMLVFWFVFEKGFRNPPVSRVPFILWLICGLLPWNFFFESWNSSTNALYQYNFLVKKVVFRTGILPIIKILSALYVHLFFIVFIFVMFGIYGYNPDLYTLQVFYYTFCMIFLLFGLSWLSSSISVFFKDLSDIIGIVLQVGFWLTPIFWSYGMLGEGLLQIIKLNPMFYIIDGYRDSFINKVWFWEKPMQTLYYWTIASVIFYFGGIIFKKLRPHFADVL